MNLIELPGIGPKSIKLLNKLNIYSINDLLNYYPFRYEVLKLNKLSESNNGDKVIVEGIVEKIPTVIRLRGNMNKMSFRVLSDNLLVNVTIFNRGFMKRHFEIGKEITIIGKLTGLSWNISSLCVVFRGLTA